MPHYLGLPSAHDDYAWFTRQRSSCLVTSDDLTYYEYYMMASTEFGCPPPAKPLPAMLSAIVQICEDDFRLTSDGLWNGPSPTDHDGAQSFANVNLTCFGKAPDHLVLTTDYQNVLDNLGKLLDDTSTEAGRYNTIDGTSRIKFHHKLFDEIDPSAMSNIEGIYFIPCSCEYQVLMNGARQVCTQNSRFLDGK